ncbi:universal stress protein [Legionella impletisoli]|uniref:Universal stress protein n=1 Tax=Legionella impletisoli TaxID=343510 RepID=A0A917JP08_9GAMM|nr:universal stress protein [Legionella impletisoli]GGI75836.1 universal stress protein [Legionella impletisoli]
MYKTILHPTDLSESHFHLCEKAVEFAKLFDAKLYLLHVIEPPASLQIAQSLGFAEFDKPRKDDARAVMSVLGEALNIPTERQFVEVGSIKMHVLNSIQQLSCELVIVGSHEPNQLPQFLGSTAHAVVQKAPCDVLTLKT